VYLLHRNAVDRSLGLRDADEHFETAPAHGIAVGRRLDPGTDFAPVAMRRVFRHLHRNPGRPDARNVHRLGCQGEPIQRQTMQFSLEPGQIEPQVHQGAEGHVAADA